MRAFVFYPSPALEKVMATITKKELIDRISEKTSNKRVVVKRVIQAFLDDIIEELGQGNRLEFRDFGVFESKQRAARVAQNPKTLERVQVPPKRTVKFKVGRLMKLRLHRSDALPAELLNPKDYDDSDE
jgi:integration host factor subunit beta